MDPDIDTPSKSQPIHATWLRRTATLCAIQILTRVRKVLRKPFDDVLFPGNGLCIKYGKRVDLAEAATLEYVRMHTCVPVPRVHCAFTHRENTYIVMQKLPGEKLSYGWRARSSESQQRILDQLKTMVDELRSLKSPHGTAVANVDGGSLTDPRLPGLDLVYPVKTSWRFGPFEDIKDFHRWLRRPAEEVQPGHHAEINELITMHETTEWGLPVFTHGDLSSLNVLVEGDKVTGIVDWEIAGWYPSYWEYTTAKQVNFRNEFWEEYIEKFIEPKPKELRMEVLRQTHFGGP